MIGRRRHWRSQPYGARLVLDDYLAAKYPLVASPYIGHVDPASGKNLSNGTPSTLASTDRGIAYALTAGSTSVDRWSYDGSGAGGPYTNVTLSEWTIIAIVRSSVGAGVQNCCVVCNNFTVGLFIGNYAGPVAGAVTVGPGFAKSGITTNIAGDGLWHVVAGSYLGSTYLRYYVDGKLDAQNTTSIPANSSSTGVRDIQIGLSPDTVYFEGNILLAVVVRAALDDGYLQRATASIEDCWSTVFRPHRVVRSAFPAGAGAGGGGGTAAYRWFLTQ